MKKLFIVLLLLALLATTTSMVFAGVDWDGDPLLSVGAPPCMWTIALAAAHSSLKVGKIRLAADAPQIRLLGPGAWSTSRQR